MAHPPDGRGLEGSSGTLMFASDESIVVSVTRLFGFSGIEIG